MIVRYLMGILFVMTLIFFFLEGKLSETFNEKPKFTRFDTLAFEHHAYMELKVESKYKPSVEQYNALLEDYPNLWAHLNQLYSTNDVVEGKEYYTEAWFVNACRNYHGVMPTGIERKDTEHHVHLVTWAWDGLACHLVDSNAVFYYTHQDHLIKITRANIALVLLVQGDHWRVDALKILSETPLYPKPEYHETCIYLPLSTQPGNPE